MIKYLIVGCGGFAGASLRYWLGGVVHGATKIFSFPVGTIAVNLLGCFAIGFLMYLLEDRATVSEEARLFLAVGVLGGFTTLSSFGYETINLARDAQYPLAIANITVTIMGGLAAVWAGNVLAHWLWR